MVITSKIIKVKSAGRYVKSTGLAIIGPQQSFYKESVSEIGYILTKYPGIDIVERINDGRHVRLTSANYNVNNNVTSKPVSVETPDAASEQAAKTTAETDSGNQEEHTDVKKPEINLEMTGKVNTSPEALAQYEATNNNEAEVSEIDAADVDDEVETSVTEQEKVETSEQAAKTTAETDSGNQEEPRTNTSSQQNTGKSKKNKNKNGHQQNDKSTEVKPEEPNM